MKSFFTSVLKLGFPFIIARFMAMAVIAFNRELDIVLLRYVLMRFLAEKLRLALVMVIGNVSKISVSLVTCGKDWSKQLSLSHCCLCGICDDLLDRLLEAFQVATDNDNCSLRKVPPSRTWSWNSPCNVYFRHLKVFR